MERNIKFTLDPDLMIEIVNYKGELLPIPLKYQNNENDLAGKQSFGYLTLLEKKAFSVSVNKLNERAEIIKKICGKYPSEMSRDEVILYNKELEKKMTSIQKGMIEKLKNDSQGILKFMWQLIRSRNPEARNHRTLRLLPNYEIVGGTDVEFSLSKMIEREFDKTYAKDGLICISFDLSI